MLFKGKAEEIFDVKTINSGEMESFISRCASIYKGFPDWLDAENDIRTINFAKAVCSETARLTTLAIGIQIDGSARAVWLQKQIDNVYFQLRHWVEYGAAYGTAILKPNGKSIDLFLPGSFLITDQDDGKITGIIFHDQRISDNGKTYYNRFEYHRTDADGIYRISNRCYKGASRNATGEPISIEETPWAGLSEDVGIMNIEQPLYGVLRTPQANNIDSESPFGLPIFAEAIEELKDLDIAYSRNSGEIKDSQKIVLLDSDRLFPSGGEPVRNSIAAFANMRDRMQLPHYIRNVYGDGQETFYQEIVPQLNTDTRIQGINNLLSQIGYKCGFSNGYFVFNESSGIATATQVEADQQRTIQSIKDMRDKLENCLDGLIYALNAFADLYGLAPLGTYEVTYDFGDITYNREEDRARWYGYVTAGKIPFWYYLVKFEGFSEEDAKAIEQEAKAQQEAQEKLFPEE